MFGRKTDASDLYAVRVKLSNTHVDLVLSIPLDATVAQLRGLVESTFEAKYHYAIKAQTFSYSGGPVLEDGQIVSVMCRTMKPNKPMLTCSMACVQINAVVHYGKRNHKVYKGALTLSIDSSVGGCVREVKTYVMPSNAHYELVAPCKSAKELSTPTPMGLETALLHWCYEQGAEFDRENGCTAEMHFMTKYIPKDQRRVALDPDYMSARWRDKLDKQTGDVVGKFLQVSIKNKEVRDRLRNLVHLKQLYENQPVFDAMLLAPSLRKLQGSGSGIVRTLGQYVEQELEEMLTALRAALRDGYIDYEGLWYHFQIGLEVVAELDAAPQPEPVGFQIEDTVYQRGYGSCFVVRGTVVKSNGKQIYQTPFSCTIPMFDGLVLLTDLNMRLMSEQDRELLERRGELFVKYAKDHHYQLYNSTLRISQPRRIDHINAKGRVMVDAHTFAERNPSQGLVETQPDASLVLEQLAPQQLTHTYPTLPAFSFVSKRWGEAYISQLAPNRFDEQAFERLVMDEEKKHLLSALVAEAQTPDLFTDILANKGCGTIFLLHGPPGTGKTLTAESIAERMHQPLYSVSVGELGTTPEQLEKRLNDVLELCAAWNAVCLLDECDIFMEARKSNESAIARNAMVGVFLRKLEYHNGTLFLTTNRVESFDEAFYSRMSLVLYYEKLGAADREQIWRNLLGAAKVNMDETGDSELPCPRQLAQVELNGREIRHMIKLAQTLALHEKSIVKMQHLHNTIEVSGIFDKKLKRKHTELGEVAEAAEAADTDFWTTVLATIEEKLDSQRKTGPDDEQAAITLLRTIAAQASKRLKL